MPRDWNYGTDRLGGASMGLDSGWRGFERYRLWVLKNSGLGSIQCRYCSIPLFGFLSGESQWWCRWAEEANQSLDILRCRCQEELLPNEFHAS
jgi:hypothetical protein